ncbi:receptor-like protein kinase ANXUR2 [Helianthus annuus]|nr:receptor-like protein kinase ANXUR2 [Helianthus annuus]
MASTPITKLAHLQIPLEEVLKATNNFHDDNIIGGGGFGRIYKGQLQRSGELIKIAALRLDRKQRERDLEFWTEISMLSDLKHTNIVSIVGFVYEKDEKIIVTMYEAKKGSLQEHLNKPNLTWTQRLKICVGVARALSYLHHDKGRSYGVIHLNVNSSTILLDENWEAKLSGFKVSIKQPLNRMDRVFLSKPIGTIGYIDPEIVKNKGVTHKSDIYAFGVVLFEMLCGRKAYIKNHANSFLDRLAKAHYKDETLHDIIHPDLRSQMSPYQMSVVSFRKCSKIAYSCLMEDRAYRPDMPKIVEELEKALTLALKFQPRPENFGKNLEHLKIRLDDIKLATSNFSETYKFSNSSLYTWYAADVSRFDKGNASSATHNFSDTYKVNFDRRYSWYAADANHFDRGNPSSTEGKSKTELSKIDNSVVVKRFLPNNDDYEEDFFFTELVVLTSVKHHNIVTLIGFCVEGFEMILVTEKFSNRYLSDHLGNVNAMCILTWEKRLKICIDIARALVYLHSEMEDKKG